MGEPKYKAQPIAPATYTLELWTSPQQHHHVLHCTIPFLVPSSKGSKKLTQIMLNHQALQVANKVLQYLIKPNHGQAAAIKVVMQPEGRQADRSTPDTFWCWVKDDRGNIVTRRSADGREVIYQALFVRGEDGVLKPQLGTAIGLPKSNQSLTKEAA